MANQIVTCTGYGGTGSSAITDLLKEFSSVLSLGEAEFWFLQDYDAISDLEYFLIDGNHRSKVSLAIKKFLVYIKKTNKYYEKYFNDNYRLLSKEYIDKLIDAKFQKALSEYEVNNFILRSLVFRILPFADLLLKKSIFSNTAECSPFIPTIKKTYSVPDRSRFYCATKDYTKKLFETLDVENKYRYLALDQLVPAINAKRYFNYVDNLKVIVVDRDPRDLYLLNETRWRGATYICDTRDVNSYIAWYKTMRLHKDFEEQDARVLHIRFEDLIYNYQSTVAIICNFIGLRLEEHTLKMKYFNPNVSKENTKLYDRNPKYSDTIKHIEDKLSDYCYS